MPSSTRSPDASAGGLPIRGVWSWGNEIVVGLRSAIFKVNPSGHAVDNSKPQDEYQARSLDGGLTWSIEKPASLLRPENGGPQPVDPPGGIDFTHRDFAMMGRASGSKVSRFYYSLDRCRTWIGSLQPAAFRPEADHGPHRLSG